MILVVNQEDPNDLIWIVADKDYAMPTSLRGFIFICHTKTHLVKDETSIIADCNWRLDLSRKHAVASKRTKICSKPFHVMAHAGRFWKCLM